MKRAIGTMTSLRQLELPDGMSIPALGLGTWRMGESRASRQTEVAAVRTAIGLGYRLIDTAEMYGEGGAEEVVGHGVAEAVRAGEVRREELLVVSKVYPHNASRLGTVAACDRSRKRLGMDQIDLYLLHWRGEHPLRETVDGMQALVAAGKIRHWGVSNLDVDDMKELTAIVPARRKPRRGKSDKELSRNNSALTPKRTVPIACSTSRT